MGWKGSPGVRERGLRIVWVSATLVAAMILVTSCRSMKTYEPLLDPVSHLDVRLDPCPQSPNCVSSQAWDPGQRVAPVPFSGIGKQALARWAALIEAEPNAVIVERRGIYLHAEFRSRVFRFVDDFELLVDEEAGVVHVRSASRLGWSDLGANRRRVERLRRAFGAVPVPSVPDGTPLVPIQ